MPGPHGAATVTPRLNRSRINGLAQACAGYPQACQHNLWVSGAAHGGHVRSGCGVHRRGVVMRRAVTRGMRWPSSGLVCITRAKVLRIKGLASRCAGYPQACQHFLWRSRGARVMCNTPVNATHCPDSLVRSRSADPGHTDFLKQVRARDGGRSIDRQPGDELGMREGRAKCFARFSDRA